MQPAARFVTAGLATDLVDEIDNIHVLLQPLEYDTALLSAAGLRRITVPAGFRTDFASVPRLPLAYLLVGGKGKRAAVIHDWLYSGGIAVSRDQADAVFREALAASGYGWLVQTIMFAGVRVGGESRFVQPNLAQPAHVAAVMEWEAP